MIFEEYWRAHGQECIEELRHVIQNAFEAGRDAGQYGRQPLLCTTCAGQGRINIGSTNEQACPQCGGFWGKP